MRVTTKMINNSMMANISKNKVNLDNLNNQYTTGNKIQKPSEDPIIAVRTLKLRKTLSEIAQYTEKNIPDAMSWMDITQSSMESMDSIMTQIYGYLNQGATDVLSTSERKTIAENLEQLKNEIYTEGNANYAGRYVFTGFKTDTPLTFQEECDDYRYTITENFDLADIDEVSKLEGAYTLLDYDSENSVPEDFAKTPVETIVHKLQLGYKDLCPVKEDENGNTLRVAASFQAIDENTGIAKDFSEFGITVVQRSAYDKNAYDISVPLTDVDGNLIDKNGVTRFNADGDFLAADGTELCRYDKVAGGYSVNEVSQIAAQYSIDVNTMDPDNDGLVTEETFKEAISKSIGVDKFAVYIPETGELVFSDDAHDRLRNETKGITAVYDKEHFVEEDVRPEHYYSCIKIDKGITNPDLAKTEYTFEQQDIQYEINFSQKMKINTQMSDAIGNDFARTIDNLVAIVNEVTELESQIADVDSFLGNVNITENQKNTLTALKSQLETQLTIKNKMMTLQFEDTMADVKNYQVKLNSANANLGSRYARIEMVGDRLGEQYTEYEELLSENIDVDLVETYINLNSADTVYNASLQTAAKIAQNSLLDFIN